MIIYRVPGEQEFLFYYAKTFGRQDISDIITAGNIESSVQAQALAEFFWQLTDRVVIDQKASVVVNGSSDLKSMNEYVFDSIRAALYNNGFANEWEAESDNA